MKGTQGITNDINYCNLSAAQQFVQNVAAAGTPVALTTNATYFRKAYFFALKTEAGGANTGVVKLGVVGDVNKQPIILNPGDSWVVEAPVGAKYDFRGWFVDAATNGDGILTIYA